MYKYTPATYRHQLNAIRAQIFRDVETDTELTIEELHALDKTYRLISEAMNRLDEIGEQLPE